MNRFVLALILSVLPALALSACGRDDATPSAGESQRNEPSAAVTENRAGDRVIAPRCSQDRTGVRSRHAATVD